MFTKEGKMDNDEKYRSVESWAQSVRWRLADGSGASAEAGGGEGDRMCGATQDGACADVGRAAVARALEGHRRLLLDVASHRGVVPPPIQLTAPLIPGHPSAPLPYTAYMALLQRHLDALRHLQGDGDATSTQDTRSDDSGVSSNQSSSSSLTLLLTTASSKDILQSEDQECEETFVYKDMEVRRTPGNAGLDIKAHKLEANFSLNVLRDEVRRHKDFLTQVWSKRRMPGAFSCHNGDSDTALNPVKSHCAWRPLQLTEAQLREGAEAVLCALDEALEATLKEEAAEKRRARQAEIWARQEVRFAEAKKKAGSDGCQLSALEERQRRLLRENAALKKSAAKDPAPLHTSETFLTLTSSTLPNVTPADPPPNPRADANRREEGRGRWTTRRYLEKLAQRRRSDETDAPAYHANTEAATSASKIAVLYPDPTNRHTVNEKTGTKEFHGRKVSVDTNSSTMTSNILREIHKFDGSYRRNHYEADVKANEMVEALRPRAPCASQRQGPCAEGSAFPPEQSFLRPPRRKVRAQSACLPYALLRARWRAKTRGPRSPRRTLSVGALGCRATRGRHRVQARRVMAISSGCAETGSRCFRLGEKGLDVDVATSWCGAAATTQGAALGGGAARVLGRVTEPRHTSLPPFNASSPTPSPDVRNVEAPPASGRRLQRHLARLSEPQPTDLALSSLVLGSASTQVWNRMPYESISSLEPWSTPSSTNALEGTPAGTHSCSLPPPMPVLLPPTPLLLPQTTPTPRHSRKGDGPFAEVRALYQRLRRAVRRLEGRKELRVEGLTEERWRTRAPARRPIHFSPPDTPLDAGVRAGETERREDLRRRGLCEEEEDDEASTVVAVGEGEGAETEQASAGRGHGHLWLQGYLSLFALLCVLYPWPGVAPEYNHDDIPGMQ